jgi:outer membrane protein insertion porin family
VTLGGAAGILRDPATPPVRERVSRGPIRWISPALLALAMLGVQAASGQEAPAGGPPAQAPEPEAAEPLEPFQVPVPLRPPGGGNVIEVRVAGNRRIESDAIRAVLTTKVNEPFRSERIRRDIRRIYELGFFRDVQVVSEDVSGGRRVTFVVEENPQIRRVTISGNDNLKEEDIKEKLRVSVGSTIDYPLLVEQKELIQGLYQTKGYYQAEVKYEVEPMGEGVVGVNFDVTEGPKLKLRQIRFDGNDHVPDDDLLKVMQTKRWRWYSFVSRFWDHSGLYAEPIFLGDLDRVSRVYMDRGFIRVAIGQPQVDVDDDGISVRVHISEGPQYKVGRIDVLGDETMDRDQLVRQVRLHPGEVFSRGTLSDDVERLKGYYQDRGFFDASVNPATQVKPDDLSVDVTFEVEKGGLFFVDQIQVNENKRTRERVIRRELSIAEGELYSREAVQRSQRRVRRLGYFDDVQIEPRRLDEPGRVALDVDVTERATGSFSFGAGVGSIDGFVVTGSLRQDNLFGTGRAMNASVDLGSQNSRAFVSFIEPYAFGTAASFSTTLSSLEREYIDFDESITGISLLLEYPLDEHETIGGTGYSFSNREVESIESFEAASLLQREEFSGNNTTSQLSFSLRRDTRDDIRFPSIGYITGGSVDVAGVGGVNKFLRLEGRTTHWLPIGFMPFPATFVVNSRIGWALPFNEVEDFDLPPCAGADCQAFVDAYSGGNAQGLEDIDDDLELQLTERYFLGGLGAFQVRGFKQRSLGPRRTILSQKPNVFVAPPLGAPFADPRDRVFFPFGRDGNGGCTIGNRCNDLDDTDPDDFEDLELTDVIGGNKMFLLNLELEFPISTDLGLKGFFFLDMGNAFAENESISVGDLRYGTGAGVHWFSPFGPITLVLGVPLDRLEDEDASVFEFNMGGSNY